MEGMIGEIRLFAGNFAPKNWSFCFGQTIAISSNTALFSILGTTYGGNGTTTFQLPDLQGRVAIGYGNAPGLGSFQLGEKSGSESVTLTSTNLPAHTHAGTISSNNGSANQASPVNGIPAVPSGRSSTPGTTVQVAMYGPAGGGALAQNAVNVQNTGNNQPISILNPYLGMNYVICMYGVYPSRG